MIGSALYVAVIDDDKSYCASMGRLLRAAGIEAISYGSAEAFLNDGMKPRFNCLLLDIELGGMSGIELALRLAAGDARPPIIFLTAVDDAETRARAERAGCAAYFHKSDPGQAVLDVIRRLLAC